MGRGLTVSEKKRPKLFQNLSGKLATPQTFFEGYCQYHLVTLILKHIDQRDVMMTFNTNINHNVSSEGFNVHYH